MRPSAIVCAYFTLLRFAEQHNHTHELRSDTDLLLALELRDMTAEIDARARSRLCRAMNWDAPRCARALETLPAQACRRQDGSNGVDSSDDLDPVPWR